MSLSRLHFLTPGNYADDHPADGLEETLALFGFGEALGYDGAWIRQRHLEHGVSSAAVFLAAAAQRTSSIELGTAVIPIGYENPFRLAEDLSTVDVLSHGRLQPGFSTGMPHAELLGSIVHDGDWRGYELSYGRIEKVRQHLRGEYLGDEDTVIHSPGNVQRPRLQPHAPGLADRVWYGAGSLRSAAWAGEQGLHLLTGNVLSGQGSTDFGQTQLALLATYRERLGSAHRRVALGRVIVPTDSADAATRAEYHAYAQSRDERTRTPQGPNGTLFARDLVGPSDQIVEQLAGDPVFAEVDELRLELPYEFDLRDYEQILVDVVEQVAPQLGWTPSQTPVDRLEVVAG